MVSERHTAVQFYLLSIVTYGTLSSMQWIGHGLEKRQMTFEKPTGKSDLWLLQTDQTVPRVHPDPNSADPLGAFSGVKVAEVWSCPMPPCGLEDDKGQFDLRFLCICVSYRRQVSWELANSGLTCANLMRTSVQTSFR